MLKKSVENTESSAQGKIYSITKILEKKICNQPLEIPL